MLMLERLRIFLGGGGGGVGHQSMVELLEIQSHQLFLSPLVFPVIRQICAAKPGLADLDAGGIVCRSGELPCLPQQVISNM
jgi:hypothetical protein